MSDKGTPTRPPGPIRNGGKITTKFVVVGRVGNGLSTRLAGYADYWPSVQMVQGCSVGQVREAWEHTSVGWRCVAKMDRRDAALQRTWVRKRAPRGTTRSKRPLSRRGGSPRKGKGKGGLDKAG